MKMVMNKKLFIFFAVIFSVIFLTMNVSALTQIHNCQELQNIGPEFQKDYILVNDIDCSATNPSDPSNLGTIWDNGGLGFDPIEFDGSFDGKDYVIKNLYINRPNENIVGLFATNSEPIKNMGLVDAQIIGKNYVGGLVGEQTQYGTISNSYVIGDVVGEYYVGGLVGLNKRAGSYEGKIIESSFEGFVDASSGGVAGGLVGGGGGRIENSYAKGQVSGSSAGGLIGYNFRIGPETIYHSYAANNVYGNSIGGIVGLDDLTSLYGYYTNVFWDGEISGPTFDSGSGIDLTDVFKKNTADMKTQSTFTDAGWDFTNIWKINEGQTYPFFKKGCSNQDPTCDNVDDDCDGQIDEDFTPSNITIGEGICRTVSTSICVNGVESFSASKGNPEPEVCDGLDNDCDGYTDEETNVCNKGGYCDGQQGCIYPEAYWASDLAGNNRITTERDLILNNNYSLVLKNAPSIPSGKAWEFEIYEKDLANADDEIRVGTSGIFGYTSGNKVIARWKITSQDVANADETFDGNPFKFYFKVSIVDHAPSAPSFTGNVISGNQIDQAPPSSGQGPADQGPVTEYTYSSGNLELKSSSQQGCFDNDNDGFNDVGCGGNDCDDQNASINPDATETCDSVDNNCNGQTDESCIDCSQYVLCSDYNSNLCASDPCAIAASSVQSSDQNADCINNVCECSYDTTTTNCSSSYSIMGDLGFPLGSCQKTEDTTDTCEGDNILTYSWTAEWVWSQENEDYKTENGAYYDPDGKAAECVDGEQTISCPNQVQLPLVSWFGITGTILFISLGYFLLKRKELKNGNKK